MSKARSKIAFFDARAGDATYYQDALDQEFELSFIEAPLTADTAGRASQADIVSVHVTSQVTSEVLKHLSHVKLVACRTTGYDHVDTGYAKQHNITVTTVPTYGEDTVAEYTFLLLLAVSRRLMLSAHSVHAGVVVPDKIVGNDIFGKTLGIFGTGHIGRKVATIARGFGMKVIAHDLYPDLRAAEKLGYQYVTHDELLAEADCISLHAPATVQTHHLLNSSTLKLTKPGVIIVNTARGSLIDTQALADALASGHVGAAGLDVLDNEEKWLNVGPDRAGGSIVLGPDAKKALGIDVFSRMPNVLVTSHNAFNSHEALDRIRVTTVANIQAFSTGAPSNAVN